MRLALACVLAALLAAPMLASSAGAAQGDRVVNGGFELGAGPLIDLWTSTGTIEDLRASDAEAPEGANVLVYQGAMGAVRSLTFGSKSNDELTITAMVRDVGPVPAEVGVEFYRFETLLSRQTLGPRAPSATWEELTVHAYAPLGTTRAMVIVTGTPATLSFVDSVSATG